MPLVIGLSAALAALSLLLLGQPTYDPLAWLIWGRQISEGTLETIAGPSWKPLPVGFTAPFALLGDDAAVALWLVVARTGGLLALAGVYRLVVRLGGGAAGGVVGAAGLLLATGVLSGVTRGNSEGLLVAAVVWALERHLAGARRTAFALGVAAALLRPEVWPFLALYALWLVRESEAPARALAWIGGCGVVVAAAWFIPEYIGSGDFLRAASRAREPVDGSPGASEHPFLTVFPNSAKALAYPLYAGGVLATLVAWSRRDRRVLAVAALATGLMLVVAALAQGGFTGNLRYVTLPAALVCVLGGVGWGWLGSLVDRRVLALAVVAALPGAVMALDVLRDEVANLERHEALYDDLPRIVERAGGRGAIVACGRVFTGPFQTQALAWELHLRQRAIGLRPVRPGVILAERNVGIARDERFPLRARTDRWTARMACTPEVQSR